MTPFSWPALWKGALMTLAIAGALSTQLLFQHGLYDWPLDSILLGWLDHLMDQLIVAVCIFASVALVALIPAASTPARIGLLGGAIAAGALLGEGVVMLRLPLAADTSGAAVLAAKTARWVVIGGLAYAFFMLRRAGAQAAAAVHDKEVQRIRLERQMSEARLHSLHAQIEPHFLFNTLANVQRLYRTEPERGREMLASFLAYLRAALPQMRGPQTSLRQEVELARTYLEVLRVRMGRRLRFSIDVPTEYGALPFPPLALSTLTENAIKHGLNPLPEGGEIEIRATIENRSLRVDVADTGAGLQSSSGPGAGLANLRARLDALYGEAAGLEVKSNTPRGIRATIVVPVEPVSA